MRSSTDIHAHVPVRYTGAVSVVRRRSSSALLSRAKSAKPLPITVTWQTDLVLWSGISASSVGGVVGLEGPSTISELLTVTVGESVAEAATWRAEGWRSELSTVAGAGGGGDGAIGTADPQSASTPRRARLPILLDKYSFCCAPRFSINLW